MDTFFFSSLGVLVVISASFASAISPEARKVLSPSFPSSPSYPAPRAFDVSPSAAFGGGYLDVTAYGAKGDGKTPDDKAFEAALSDAASMGGAVVLLPAGNYLITGTLVVPNATTIQGVWRGPGTEQTVCAGGSYLLTTQGRGNASGTPFITLSCNAGLRGIAIFHPEQNENDIQPYPWTVLAQENDGSLVDVLLVNAYQGANVGIRHYIKGLYGSPLLTGLLVDRTTDIGRVEDVHFHPVFWNWRGTNFTMSKGTAFVFARTDWEYVYGCFAFEYSVVFHFTSFEMGPGNVILANSGGDEYGISVLVDSLEPHAGLSFSNGSHQGPVKFTSCGFWGIQQGTPLTDTHIINEGSGHVFLTACHFIHWAQSNTSAPAVLVSSGGLTATGCDFVDTGRNQIELGSEVEAAVITSNRMRGGVRVPSAAPANRSEIGLNVVF